ncbi:LOW QUALITY PROTEIN: Pol protein, partial [Phytophthora palmivora]
MSLTTDRETKAHCQACGIAMTSSPNAKRRRTVWPSTVVVPDGTDQAGNISPQAEEAAEESAEAVSGVGNIGPQAGNIGPQAAEAAEEGAESASSVGNIVPHKVEETEKKIESAAGVSSVGNVVPRGVKKTSTSAEVSLSTSCVDNQVPHSESETPQARPVEEQSHVFAGRQVRAGAVHLEALPEVSALLNLEELSMKDFLAELKAGEIAEMVLLKPETSPEDLNSSSVMDEDVLEGFTKQRATCLDSEILKNPVDPVYPLVKAYSDVVSKHPPSQLPPDRGVRHEIDLVPGTKYCVTRQWPLPREQCKGHRCLRCRKAKSGMVRESKSPHSTPTFCVRKPNGKWRLVHAYNKLNNATVPAQTPIHHKDVLLNKMSGCTLYSALDLVDGYYQILMRESDIPLTAVSTPSGMLWEWLVMSQGLSNTPATFNRLVTQLVRPFVRSHRLDDIFVHSRAEDGQTAMEVHLRHLRRVFEVMRANKLYANIDECVFAAEVVIVLGCYVSRVGVRTDPGKVKSIATWSTPRSPKDLRKWLGLASYLYKYSAGYAELARPLSDLLKKDADWQAAVLALPDENKSFSVVCDVSDYAIGYALLQKDDEGHERVISFQSRQLKAAERNYPVHDKELLAMNSSLGHEALCDLYGSRVLADCHQLAASVAADGEVAVILPEYNFSIEYKPGKLYVLADALSRRSNYERACQSSDGRSVRSDTVR